jgi:hypothetical protein
MENLIQQLSQDALWNKWVVANSSDTSGCIPIPKDGCISVKDGCISAPHKTGCIS